MIISHRHRFIFVAVPKTGTHSVRRALREHMAPGDAEQVGLFVNRRFDWPELAAIAHGHLSLQQVRPFLGKEAFGGYFKFAFVRNPFARFVSYCAFMLRGSDAFVRNPRAVMQHFLFEKPPEQHILFQSQASLLIDQDGAMLADAVGRVETMQESYAAICHRIGLPSRPLNRVNASVHADYRHYYDAPLAEAVAKRYAEDIKLFSYSFDGGL